MKALALLAGLALAALAIGALAFRPDRLPASATAGSLGLPPLPTGTYVGTPAQIELGRKLFFDRRLSFNGTMSCAMCHVPEEGFASHASKTAVGIEGKSLRRNAPTLLNVAWQRHLFHDGREASLISQAWAPMLHPEEMANPSISHVLDQIHTVGDYAGRFETAFAGHPASMDTVGLALAAYQATLVAGDSRFDRWRYTRQAGALSDQEQRGLDLFTGKARCSACHLIGPVDALFADGRYHVTGVGFPLETRDVHVVPLAPGVETRITELELQAFASAAAHDLGRFEITLLSADRYAFKTPSLRNVSLSAPYMHDGSLASLEEVVSFYNEGGGQAPNKSELLARLGLTRQEQGDLVAFMKSLDGASVARLMNERQAHGR